MAFVEVLVDGLTVGGRVRMAGEVVRAPAFEPMSKSDQVKKWGQPRYKEISEKEFNERGGTDEVALPVELTPPEPPAKEPEAPVAGEFDEMVEFDVDATLDAAASFDDEKVARFVEWEKANKNRKTVLEPLGVEVE